MTGSVPPVYSRVLFALKIFALAVLLMPAAAGAQQSIPPLSEPTSAGSSRVFNSPMKGGLEYRSADVLGRSGTEKRKTAETVFGITEEVPGVRIGWYIDDTLSAFKIAIDRKLPLVLLAGEDWCKFCWQMLDSFTCPAVNRFAGSAIFAVAAADRDKAAKAMIESLKIDAYPVVMVTQPEASILVEVGRINGYFHGALLAQHLETIRTVYPRTDGDLPALPAWTLPAVGSQAAGAAFQLSKTPQFKPDCG